MGGQISKHDTIPYRSGSVDRAKDLPNGGVGGSSGVGLMFLPSFLRRRKTKKKESYFMDATTSRFFHGDATTTISASCSNDSVVSTSSDQALQHKLSSIESIATGDGSSSGSIEDNHILSNNDDCTANRSGSNSNDPILYSDRYPTTTCCVDDYLTDSVDSDSLVDRYHMFVSIQLAC